jgi:hypothetical protein
LSGNRRNRVVHTQNFMRRGNAIFGTDLFPANSSKNISLMSERNHLWLSKARKLKCPCTLKPLGNAYGARALVTRQT